MVTVGICLTGRRIESVLFTGGLLPTAVAGGPVVSRTGRGYMAFGFAVYVLYHLERCFDEFRDGYFLNDKNFGIFVNSNIFSLL